MDKEKGISYMDDAIISAEQDKDSEVVTTLKEEKKAWLDRWDHDSNLFAVGIEGYPQEIAESYGCYGDKQHYENNEKGVKQPYKWGFIKELPSTSSVVFWCKDKDKSKIVVHVDSSKAGKYTNPFSACPDQISEVIGGSTGIWVESDAIYTGVEDGIYYFCKDGKWENSEWH